MNGWRCLKNKLWLKVKSIDFEEIQDRMNVKECVEGLSVLF